MSQSKQAEPWREEKKNVRLVGHSDLNGWGMI